MTPSDAPAPSPTPSADRAGQDDPARLRRARIAVGALFLTNGAIFANILPRFPEVKASLGMDNTLYGLALAAFPAGAIASGLFSAVLIRRFGSAPVAVLGTLLTATGVLAAGLAPAVSLFALSLFLGGACDSVTDVAQNSHGLRVQKLYRRSIINSFHAVWSLGAVLGGSMAALALALDVPLGVHLTVSALLFGAVSLTALRFCLPGKDTQDEEEFLADPDEIQETMRRGPSARVVLTLGALVLLALAGALVEDAASSWATLYLATDLGAPGPLAASGYLSLMAAMLVGRLLGDPMVDRWGRRAVARSGGLLIAVGMGLALAFPSVPGTLAGFAAAGFGTATLVPAAMNQADELEGLRHGTGLTLVSWLMRLGFLLSPPIVGLVADAAGLRTGLLVLPLAGVAAFLVSGVLTGRPAPRARA